jgi:transaldolase
MKIFIDTADLSEIKWANELGILDGVTTNPTLMYKAGGKNFEQHIKEICKICKGPVSAEVLSLKTGEIVKEAEKNAKWAKNVVIKVPITEDGLKAIKILEKKGIKTNATLCFSANQALLAAKAGASFVSPFIGRLDDRGEKGMDLVEEIVKIYKNYNFKTQLIVASIRNVEHVREAAKFGAPIATIPPNVLRELSKHELTDTGIQRFLEDWKKLKK